MERLLRSEVIVSPLGFRRVGRDSTVGRVNDQGCPTALDDVRSAFRPEVIVSPPGEIGCAALAVDQIEIGLLNALLLVRRDFLLVKNCLSPSSAGRWRGSTSRWSKSLGPSGVRGTFQVWPAAKVVATVKVMNGPGNRRRMG
jgi:hypothetical protein